MNTEHEEVAADIRALARDVRRATGLFTVYEENMHSDNTTIEVWVAEPSGDSAHTRFKGAEQPFSQHEKTLYEMRDELTSWLAERRKEAA